MASRSKSCIIRHIPMLATALVRVGSEVQFLSAAPLKSQQTSVFCKRFGLTKGPNICASVRENAR